MNSLKLYLPGKPGGGETIEFKEDWELAAIPAVRDRMLKPNFKGVKLCRDG